MFEFINFYFIPGVVLGCIYALGAVGISLLFGILRFAHFAHGDLMTFGAYVALVVVTTFGIPAMGAIPVAMLVSALLAVGIDRFFYKPFRESRTIILVISSFGISLMLRSAVQFFFGVDVKVYQRGIQRPLVFFDTLRIAERHLWIVGGAIVIIVLVHLFLRRTRLGKAMRAMSDDADLALVSGIHTERVIMVTWGIGAALAAVAGVFLGIDTQLHSNMGWDQLLPLFAAAILGGIGRPYGAIAGALVIGMAEELSAYPWIGNEPLLSPGYKTGVAFAIMIGMLIWRPSGLFRGRVF